MAWHRYKGIVGRELANDDNIVVIKLTHKTQFFVKEKRSTGIRTFVVIKATPDGKRTRIKTEKGFSTYDEACQYAKTLDIMVNGSDE